LTPAGTQGMFSRLPRSIKATSLSTSLVLSALATNTALRSPDCHWLAWFSFLPLFVAVRSLRPLLAALAGGMWGACLYVCASIVVHPAAGILAPAISASAWLPALLIVIPAVYVGLAARPARAVGFKLLTLALGWTLFEVVLHLYNPSSPREGLLTGSQGECLRLHWLARLLGYVATAFLVAFANASLLGMVSGSRLSLPACQSLTGRPNFVGWHPLRVLFAIQSRALHTANPRAPPIRAAAVN